MKISKSIYFIFTFALTTLLSTTVLADDSFFEVGKTYLFTPRLDLVMKGKVVQVTPQEVVFTDRYILKASKAAMLAKNDDAKSAMIKSKAIVEYMKSKNKAALLEPSPLKDLPTSYSRSEMSASKIDE